MSSLASKLQLDKLSEPLPTDSTHPDSPAQPLSQAIASARLALLDSLKTQLDSSLVAQLVAHNSGVPFTDFEADSPQVEAIKKVINCLFHAEQGLKEWEAMDTSTLLGKASAVPQAFKALTQVYKSLALLNDASPEIKNIIMANYHLLSPVFTRTYSAITDAGFITEFNQLEVAEKARSVLSQGIDLGRPGLNPKQQGNPLMAAFRKLTELIDLVISTQDRNFTEEEDKELSHKISLLLFDLDNNPYFRQFRYEHVEGSQGLDKLLSWFHSIEEDGSKFTEKSIQQYITWANEAMPELFFAIDQFEQQNYLKPGLLGQSLAVAVDQMTQVIDAQLASATYNLPNKINKTADLSPLRVAKIEQRRKASDEKTAMVNDKITQAESLFTFLKKYQGQEFAAILEADRVSLRQIYPKVQDALAYCDLTLENELTAVLNQVGPKTAPAADNSWWGYAKGAANYVASYVLAAKVDKVLAQQQPITTYLNKQVLAEKTKVAVLDNATQLIQPSAAAEQPDPITKENQKKQKVAKKKSTSGSLPTIAPGQLVPVNAASVNNLRGNLLYLQRLKLSETLATTSGILEDLISEHLPPEEAAYFSKAPYDPDSKEPDGVKQLKQLANGLYYLQQALVDFEQLEVGAGLISQTKFCLQIASSAVQLKQAVDALSPVYQQQLAPVMARMVAYGNALTNLNQKSNDLSSLEQLKSIPVAPTPQPASHTPVQTAEPQPIKKPASDEFIPYYEEHIRRIHEVREQLMARLQNHLVDDLSGQLTPQTKGVPFIHLDNDVPQLAAIKKIFNSLYYAEVGTQLWQDKDKHPRTPMGKVAYAHEVVTALSQFYKTLTLLSHATPELQSLIVDNYDLLGPIFQSTNQLMNQSDWLSKLTSTQVVETAGIVVGQGVNLFQPRDKGTKSSSSVVQLLTDLPSRIHSVATTITDKKMAQSELRIDRDSITAMSSVFELLFGDSGSIFAATQARLAVNGFNEIMTKVQNSSTHLQDIVLTEYQQWVAVNYPLILARIDEIETRYYVKPGSLSAVIIQEMDAINDKLNEKIENEFEGKVKKIKLSDDLIVSRVIRLEKNKRGHRQELKQIEMQQDDLDQFFKLIERYKGKSFAEVSTDDRQKLKELFNKVQLPLTNADIDRANDLVLALNDNSTKDLHLDSILHMRPAVEKIIGERTRSLEFRVKVIDKAIQKLTANKKLTPTKLQSHVLAELRAPIVFQETEVAAKDIALKPIASSSLHNARGNLARIQNLGLHALSQQLANAFLEQSKSHLSPIVLTYLNDRDSQGLHPIKTDDPSIVRQIKGLENALVHLQAALKRLEEMKIDNSLAFQAAAIIQIRDSGVEVKDALYKLSPELKVQYGPLIQQLTQFGQAVQSIDYKKEDIQELQALMQGTKSELLKKKPRPAIAAQSSFFSSSGPVVEEPKNWRELGQRGAKLAVKYAHGASPQLEQGRVYLINRYAKVFAKSNGAFRSLAHHHFIDESHMQDEVDRLSKILDESFGINITTGRALYDLFMQMVRVTKQGNELGAMVNKLVTEDYIKIKVHAYRDVVHRISQQEDDLGLKSGTLLDVSMDVVSQLFLSAAFEINMPFKKKIHLFNDALYINVLIGQVKQELAEIKTAVENNPTDPELKLKRQLKEDKLLYLEDKVKALEIKDIDEIKSILLDGMFQSHIRYQLFYTSIQDPIAQQYKRAFQAHLDDFKAAILASDDVDLALAPVLKTFINKDQVDYFVVDKGYRMLERLNASIPAEHSMVKSSISKITELLIDEKIPIAERAQKVKSLPSDTQFLDTIRTVDGGPSFLRRLKQFVDRVIIAARQAFHYGSDFFIVYKQIRLEQTVDNIEKHHLLKANLQSMKPDPDEDAPEKGMDLGKK